MKTKDSEATSEVSAQRDRLQSEAPVPGVPPQLENRSKATPEATTRDWNPPAALADTIQAASLDALVLVPLGERDDGKYVLPQSSRTIVKLLRGSGVPVVVPVDTQALLYKEQYSVEWFGPMILISSALYSENSSAVSVALNLISSYVHDLFKGQEEKGKAHLSVAVARNGAASLKVIHYQGPVSGIKDLSAAVIEALREDSQKPK